MDTEHERKLVADLIDGDETAFCQLYSLYKERLLYFAVRFLKSADFAEDVFQDAFASVWQNRRFINPNEPFAPYIYTVIKNRILNLLAGIEKEQELKKVILSNSIDFHMKVEEEVIESELDKLLEKALEELTPQQRNIFEMSRKEYKPHKQIAQELNISVYTVQQHISTSIKKIKSYLEKYGEAYTDIVLLLICLSI